MHYVLFILTSLIISSKEVELRWLLVITTTCWFKEDLCMHRQERQEGGPGDQRAGGHGIPEHEASFLDETGL